MSLGRLQRRRGPFICSMIASTVLLAGCYSYRLAPEDAMALREIAPLALRAYELSGPATLQGQFDRAIVCDADGALLRNDAGVPDAGPIVCKPKPVVKPPPLPATCLSGVSCVAGHCVCEWDIDAGSER